MMQSAVINVRVNCEDKKKFEEFCDNVGMNVSTAINIFIKRVINENRFPFEIRNYSFDDYVFEKIKEAEKEIDDNSKKYSREEVMNNLNNIIGDKK